MEQVVLATQNQAKQRVLKWILEGICQTNVLPGEFFKATRFEEGNESHIENAIKKTMAVSTITRGMAIGTDGGLLIPALGKTWTSTRTRRFAGPNVSDTERLDALLELMTSYTGRDRRISWVEAVVLVRYETVLACWEVEGANGFLADHYNPDTLIPGFWVYSLWDFPQLGKSYLDLTEEDSQAVKDPWWTIKSEVRKFFLENLVRR